MLRILRFLHIQLIRGMEFLLFRETCFCRNGSLHLVEKNGKLILGQSVPPSQTNTDIN